MANAFNTVYRTGLFIQTTNGDFNPLGSFTTQRDKTYFIRLIAVAQRTSGSESAGYQRAATFRNVAGTVTQVGATTSVALHEDDATWDLDFLITGVDIGIRAKGNPGKIVNWRADLEIYVVGVEAEQT